MGRVIAKIKYTIFFSIGFFLVTGLLGVLVLWYTHTSYVRELYISSLKTLNSTLTKKIGTIENDLSSMEHDVEVLSQAPEIQSILGEQTFFDKSAIVRDVDRRAQVIVSEVENYILAHPEMTLGELQKSQEFQSIALQSVGKEGYSALANYEEQVIVMHKLENFVGLDFDEPSFRNWLPQIYKLQIESRNESQVFGFYDWEEPSGEIRKKYLRLSRISVRTADDVGLSVAVTAYVDDYKIIPKISPTLEEYVDTFKKDFGYFNILFITPSGHVVYGAEEDPLLGGNLTWRVNKEGGLALNYARVAEENETSFFGPFIGSYGDIYPNFSIMAPVFTKGDKKLLGFVAIVDTMDGVFTIAEERTDLSDTQETYLVNEDALLISPVRLRDLDIFVQPIRSDHAENCFTESHDARHKDNTSETFLNYRGDEVLGLHTLMQKTRWCVLTEVSLEEAVTLPARKQTKDKMPLFFGVLGLLTLTGSGLGWFMDKRKKQPWYKS